MSRGLSRLQRGILGLLAGEMRPQVFGSSAALDTGELLEEMIAHDLISEEMPHKQALFTIRRACLSLARRGFVVGQYVPDMDHCGATTIQWTATNRTISPIDKTSTVSDTTPKIFGENEVLSVSAGCRIGVQEPFVGASENSRSERK
jgi:hypothetical protein